MIKKCSNCKHHFIGIEDGMECIYCKYGYDVWSKCVSPRSSKNRAWFEEEKLN